MRSALPRERTAPIVCDVRASNTSSETSLRHHRTAASPSARHQRTPGAKLTTLQQKGLVTLCVMHAPSHAKSAKGAEKDRGTVASHLVTRGGSTVLVVKPLGRSRGGCRLLLTGFLS